MRNKKDTCNIIEKILILEISLLANLIDSFQEQILSSRPLLLQQYNHMSQCHVIPVVCEGSELQDKIYVGKGNHGNLQHTRIT